jgi:hypothetical protein
MAYLYYARYTSNAHGGRGLRQNIRQELPHAHKDPQWMNALLRRAECRTVQKVPGTFLAACVPSRYAERAGNPGTAPRALRNHPNVRPQGPGVPAIFAAGTPKPVNVRSG